MRIAGEPNLSMDWVGKVLLAVLPHTTLEAVAGEGAVVFFALSKVATRSK